MNKLRTLTKPEDHYITPNLAFAATLVCLGFSLVDTTISSDGNVSFVFASGGKDLQELYERWHLQDIPIGTKQFTIQWRRLRRLISSVKDEHFRE